MIPANASEGAEACAQSPLRKTALPSAKNTLTNHLPVHFNVLFLEALAKLFFLNPARWKRLASRAPL